MVMVIPSSSSVHLSINYCGHLRSLVAHDWDSGDGDGDGEREESDEGEVVF